MLPVGPEPIALPVVDVAPVRLPPGDTVVLRAVLGPRADFVTDPAELTGTTWTASSRSDRIGMRLEGGKLRRVDNAEMPSEGMLRGAIQVPPAGLPVVFLADHPVTGGYPVSPRWTTRTSTARTATARSGCPLRRRPCGLEGDPGDRSAQLVDLDRGK